MRIELGNKRPLGPGGEELNLGAPSVTYLHIPDSYSFDPSLDLKDFALHLVRNPDITRLPGNEALLVVTHPLGGAWKNHSIENPTFVSCDDNPEFEAYLADFFGVEKGRPANLEQEYFTHFGQPGVLAGDRLDLEANITQNGRDIWAAMLGGNTVGQTGVGTAATSTTLSVSGLVASAWIGHRIVVYSTSGTLCVYGNILSNTTTTITVDKWYVAATPDGAAATTPSTPWAYIILDGGHGPAWYMGLSTSTTALASPSTNTTLPSEITTASGGLVRKICPYAHTASTNTYTLTPVFTANGSDVLPVTIGSIGVFTGSANGPTVPASDTPAMLFNTLLTTTATLSASGDQLTITETVTGT